MTFAAVWLIYQPIAAVNWNTFTLCSGNLGFAQLQKFEASPKRKGTGNLLPLHYHRKQRHSVIIYFNMYSVLHVVFLMHFIWFLNTIYKNKIFHCLFVIVPSLFVCLFIYSQYINTNVSACRCKIFIPLMLRNQKVNKILYSPWFKKQTDILEVYSFAQ